MDFSSNIEIGLLAIGNDNDYPGLVAPLVGNDQDQTQGSTQQPSLGGTPVISLVEPNEVALDIQTNVHEGIEVIEEDSNSDDDIMSNYSSTSSDDKDQEDVNPIELHDSFDV